MCPSSVPTPVCKPLLPSADALYPYLAELDASRVYTNFGPLSRRLRTQLAGMLGVSEPRTVLASSGTSALVIAILAAAGRGGGDRPLSLVPAYSFVATASAVEQCGYRPHFVDVRHPDAVADPEQMARHPLLARAGVVVPVIPYGRRVDLQAWADFERLTQIPVVIDAAAAFDFIATEVDLSGSLPPLAISLHATKTFSAGEGGVVVAAESVAQRALRAANFGFLGSRESVGASTNAKMSEYHAAVGLAEADNWSHKRQCFLEVAHRYLSCAEDVGLRERFDATLAYATSCVLFEAADACEARDVEAALAGEGVETRRWYSDGLHRHPHFRACSADALPETQARSARVVGLPMSVDLPADTIERIVTIVSKVVRARQSAAATEQPARWRTRKQGVS